MKNIFTDHPHSVNENYFQHMRFASAFGFKMLAGGLACLTHAIFPFLFKKTGSDILLAATFNFVERMPKLEERVLLLNELIEKKKILELRASKKETITV